MPSLSTAFLYAASALKEALLFTMETVAPRFFS